MKKRKQDTEVLNKFRGLYVEVKNGNVEGALKKLKRKMKNADWALEVQRTEFYTKPSEIRKDRKHRAKQRAYARQKGKK